MQQKMREALAALREGKVLNPKTIEEVLEWAFERDAAVGKAEGVAARLQKERDEIAARMARLADSKREDVPAMVSIYVHRLEAALLALDKGDLLEKLRQ
jgi:hypothetical protein